MMLDKVQDFKSKENMDFHSQTEENIIIGKHLSWLLNVKNKWGTENLLNMSIDLHSASNRLGKQ